MDSPLKPISSKLQVVSGCLWRLSILLLPWQTRWFGSTPLIDGFPWEQGRLSFYVSWLSMLATIFLAAFDYCYRQRSVSRRWWSIGANKKLFIGCCLLVLPTFFSLYSRASIEWWIETIILLFFVAALRSLRVSRERLVLWLTMSLLPHALLGILQSATQTVQGSSWLGMSSQQPMTPGVAVVASLGERFLRAYGGFPHPNIFGGWLAILIPLTIWSSHQATTSLRKWWFGICAVLFSVVLVLTFSRSAWIACLVGIGCVAMVLVRQMSVSRRLGWGMMVLIVSFLAATGMLVYERKHVFTRFDTSTRLEERSIDERQQALRDGWRLFQQHPWFGVGPGVTAYALKTQIVPHFVPLLLLDEIGIIGVIGFFIILSIVIQSRRWAVSVFAWISHDRIVLGLLLSLIVLAFFDHYLWSLWSGKSLLFLSLAFLSLQNRIDKDRQA